MAHEIETMMFGGASYEKALPWHGLGTFVGDKAIDAKTAIRAAGLNWRVKKLPSQSIVTDANDIPIIDKVTGQPLIAYSDEYFNIVRNTDLKVLGSVEGRYIPMQNEDCFDFMDAIAGPTADVRYHTAGSLNGGKQIWMLAKLENFAIEPVKGDLTESFLLCSSSHDGTKALRCFFTTVRVVCANTLRIAINEGAGDGISVRHTGNLKQKRAEAQRLLGLAVSEFSTYKDIAAQLVKFKVDKNYFKELMDHLLPLDPEKQQTRRENVRDKIQELFESGRGTHIPGVNGNGWGALQAITNYTNHEKSYKNTGGDNNNFDNNRLMSIWYGDSNLFAQKALKKLTADAG